MQQLIKRLSTTTTIATVLILTSLLCGQLQAAAPDPSLAPATVDPLPEGWKVGEFDVGDTKMGSNSDLNAHFELTSESKTALGVTTLVDWATLHKDRDHKDSALTNSHATDLKPAKFGDHDTLEYEVTGDLYGSPFHYKVFFADVRGVYCELSCWVEAKNWDVAKGQFDQLAAHIK